MMRKLAVTVFAMSLTLVGCGSSSTSKKDASPDASAKTDVAGKPDTGVVTPDTNPILADTGVLGDVKPADVAIDSAVSDTGPKTDVSGDTTRTADARDGSVSDNRPSDTKPTDAVKTDTKILVTEDAPVDSSVGVDADLEVGGDAETD